MPKFRFRLEAALHIAESALEEEERLLAQELRVLQELENLCRERKIKWEKALEGQREASRVRPQDLGSWQAFAAKQLEIWREAEEGKLQQQQKVELQRQKVLAAYQETEKYKRLKERKQEAFVLAENRREQKILDEAGQVSHHWRERL